MLYWKKNDRETRTNNMQEFIIDVKSKTAEFKHYWENCVGSGHASLALREDWRKALKKCHDELGFKYVRFHGLLDDDMNVCIKKDKKIQFSFYNIDSIFDFLLEIGTKPFIELGFMPECLASGTKTVYHYKGNVTPPESYDEWSFLIHTFTDHIKNRYGSVEVGKWFFEVWNEPNLEGFWSGTRDEYFELYKHSALAVKSVNAKFKVGGPATARNEWIPEFIDFCKTGNVPVDFITTHHYPTDSPFGHHADARRQMEDSRRGILTEWLRKAVSEAGGLPVYYTEWNISPSCRNYPYNDTSYSASFILKTIIDNSGLSDIYSYWTFSDIFEELFFTSIPFHGGFGLLSIHDIPKPKFRVFELLHKQGCERYLVEKSRKSVLEAAAIKNNNGICILLYNFDTGTVLFQENAHIIIKNINGIKECNVRRIDEDNANPHKKWVELGKPEYLSQEMIRDLINSSEMADETIGFQEITNGVAIDITVPGHGIAAIDIVI